MQFFQIIFNFFFSQIRLGAFNLTRRILREEGVSGMFRGLTSTIAREMPGYFVFFGGYEGTRILLTPEGKRKEECGKISFHT